VPLPNGRANYELNYNPDSQTNSLSQSHLRPKDTGVHDDEQYDQSEAKRIRNNELSKERNKL
jgi:hypothetical protein